MSKTGTYDIKSLLAARFTSAKDFGMDTIERVLNAEIAAHNMVVEEKLAELAEPTTDAQSVYGSAVGGDMTEVDEYGAAPSQKVLPGSTVAFPLQAFQFNLGWTERYFQKATPADMATAVINAEIAHKRQITRQIKRAVFLSSNYTFVDHLVDGISITVRRLLNADSEPIPAGPNGETYDGATETHYTAEASLTAANLTASIRNVVEKGHGNRVQTAINLSNEAAVRALTGFEPYVDNRLLISGNNNDPRTQLDQTKIDNRPIGIFDAAEVWVKPWAIAGYAFTYEAGGTDKVLKYRQEEAEALRGLRLAAENTDYPLHVRFMEAIFGFGVWTRTAGAVHQFTNGTYQDPTI